MRLKQSEMLANVKDYFDTNLPPKLTAEGLTAFDDYLDTPPNSDDRIQFAVYLAEGQDNVADKRDTFLIQAQLYAITNPTPYLDCIWELVQDFPPSYAGYDTKNMTWQTWYPAEQGDGYGGSFIIIELQLSKENDDCYLDDAL